jgi:hypothetical protein
MDTMKFKFYGEKYELFLEVDKYVNNDNIAIEVWDTNEGPFADLTVNIYDLPEGLACIDTNNFPDAIRLIEEYNLGEFTSNFATSGYCTYPIYKLNIENINKYTNKGGN